MANRPYILVYKDPLLTYLLVSVPSILTPSKYFKFWVQQCATWTSSSSNNFPNTSPHISGVFSGGRTPLPCSGFHNEPGRWHVICGGNHLFRTSGWWLFIVPRSPTTIFYRLVYEPPFLTHRIHVWYIYLHLVDFYGFHVGKYTIHGSYGRRVYHHPKGSFGFIKVMLTVITSKATDPWMA